jgi:hypothetical protein
MIRLELVDDAAGRLSARLFPPRIPPPLVSGTEGSLK